MVLKMIYDAKFFDQVFERRDHDATKWDYPLFVKDNKDIVPMWVADMDFRTPDCIVDAMVPRDWNIMHSVTSRFLRLTSMVSPSGRRKDMALTA